jgi:hypothetical protein
MHRQQVTTERRDDVLVSIQYDVQSERNSGRFRNRPYIVMHRVSVSHSPRRVGTADPGGVVQNQEGVEAG